MSLEIYVFHWLISSLHSGCVYNTKGYLGGCSQKLFSVNILLWSGYFHPPPIHLHCFCAVFLRMVPLLLGWWAVCINVCDNTTRLIRTCPLRPHRSGPLIASHFIFLLIPLFQWMTPLMRTMLGYLLHLRCHLLLRINSWKLSPY